MYVLTSIANLAMEQEIIRPFPGIKPIERLSIFADDVAFFIRLTTTDLEATQQIFGLFGEASGLKVNYVKSMAITICATDEEKLYVASNL